MIVKAVKAKLIGQLVPVIETVVADLKALATAGDPEETLLLDMLYINLRTVQESLQNLRTYLLKARVPGPPP